MSSASPNPAKGTWAAPSPTAARSPCPILNSLSNHGHLPRSGRNITQDELAAALSYMGFGPDIVFALTQGSFKVQSLTPVEGESVDPRGLRDEEDKTPQGVKVLHLDKVGRPNSIEHDVSLTRQDRAVGDCIHADPKLVSQFLTCPANGKVFTRADLINIRNLRYEQQQKANPDLSFDKGNGQIASGEVAFLQAVFGKGLGYEIPIEYLKPIFEEERLPEKEGWKPRWTWFTFPELLLLQALIKGGAKPIEGFSGLSGAGH